MDLELDAGEARLLELILSARGLPSTCTAESAYEALVDEHSEFGIDRVVVNRYGAMIERILDRLSDSNPRAGTPEG